MQFFGNAILLAHFLSKVARSLRVKYVMEVYLSKRYNGIQITSDSFLLPVFHSVRSTPVPWPLPCLMDPGNTRTSWNLGLYCSWRNCCFLKMLWIFVSQITLLLECLFLTRSVKFHSKLGHIKISKCWYFSLNVNAELWPILTMNF